jgi:NAD(P)H-hydrate repair Nnr-like enzyme with NAD(P)H-hydrate dehydratase domain
MALLNCRFSLCQFEQEMRKRSPAKCEHELLALAAFVSSAAGQLATRRQGNIADLIDISRAISTAIKAYGRGEGFVSRS